MLPVGRPVTLTLNQVSLRVVFVNRFGDSCARSFTGATATCAARRATCLRVLCFLFLPLEFFAFQLFCFLGQLDCLLLAISSSTKGIKPRAASRADIKGVQHDRSARRISGRDDRIIKGKHRFIFNKPNPAILQVASSY